MKNYKHYNFKEIEKDAQGYWHSAKCFYVSTDIAYKKKLYCLEMFPYTSGKLHMGHCRTYIIGDVISRQKRMEGYAVLHPMGWDAFGLPAEEAAIKHNVHPSDWTKQNIATMKLQMHSIGLSFDWSKEISTCASSYYKHEQAFFLKLLQKGLIYRKKELVYWDPVMHTVLANEQVIDGKGWRSGAQVEKKLIDQYFIKAREYAPRLYSDIDTTTWSNNLKNIQKNWIGKSEGYEIVFELTPSKIHQFTNAITCFTTRLDTIYGVQAVVIATRHPLAIFLQSKDVKLQRTVQNIDVVSEKCVHDNIMGVHTDLKVKHPIIQGKEMPVYISNFVQNQYATQAVMCVPAHDKRDMAIADIFGLSVKHSAKEASMPDEMRQMDNKTLCDYLVKTYYNSIKKATHYKLRDWSISRQRKWGVPIPVQHCDKCGLVPMTEDMLPLKPYNTSHTICRICGGSAENDPDTLDTFVQSSWYYARFVCPNSTSMVDAYVDRWLPVDYYIGGIEHATMHFLYARLFHKMMKDFGMVTSVEPFDNIMLQGLVLNKGKKMSKSKNNSIDPENVVKEYGADCLRLFIMSAAPIDQNFEWDSAGIKGCQRFLTRLYTYATSSTIINATFVAPQSEAEEITDEMYKCIKYYKQHNFNLVFSSCVILLRQVMAIKDAGIAKHYLIKLLQLLSPIVPHVTHYLWQYLSCEGDISTSKWPCIVESRNETLTIKVLINNKYRTSITIPADSLEKYVIETTCSKLNISKASITKSIYISGKILNLII